MPEVLSERHRELLASNHYAVMSTVTPAGRLHAVPVLVGLVDGELWSSGTEDRVRTRHLDAGSPASFTVLPQGFWGDWLTITGPVTIHRDRGVEDNLRLYRIIAGKDPDDLDEYRDAMTRERRLVYALRPERTYGP